MSHFRAFAIVPAAGRSTRMGRPKLLLPWSDGSMIESQLRAWRASRVAAVAARAANDASFVARVDEAALRVLRAKQAAGLLPCSG